MGKKQKKFQWNDSFTSQEDNMEVDVDNDVENLDSLEKFPVMKSGENNLMQAEMEKDLEAEADNEIMLSHSSGLNENSAAVKPDENNDRFSISKQKCKNNYVIEACQFLLQNYELVSDMNFRSINVYYPETAMSLS